MTQAAKAGDKLRIHYTGRLDDGTVFDNSEGRDPLEFTVGNGEIIPGLEKAMIGMEVGESREVTVAPEEAYGARDDQRQRHRHDERFLQLRRDREGRADAEHLQSDRVLDVQRIQQDRFRLFVHRAAPLSAPP